MPFSRIDINSLPRTPGYHELQGIDHANTPISIILVDLPPGDGPKLHAHPYQEIFIVQEGRALYTVGAETLEITAGQIVIVPPETPHKFVNSGDTPLRQVDIHLSPTFITVWLED